MTYISYNSITGQPLIQAIDTKTLGWVRKLPWEIIRKIVDFVELKNQVEIMSKSLMSWPYQPLPEREARERRLTRLLLNKWENPGPYDHNPWLKERMRRAGMKVD